MLSARLLTRNISKVSQRQFGASTKGAYKEKTTMQVWGGDAGAYPVMAVIVGAAAFSTCAALWFMTTSVDCRLSKSDRKSLFRGNLKGTDNL